MYVYIGMTYGALIPASAEIIAPPDIRRKCINLALNTFRLPLAGRSHSLYDCLLCDLQS